MIAIELALGFSTCGLLFMLLAELTKLRISLGRLANTQHRLFNHYRDEAAAQNNQNKT
jgi:hypothetical protein